MHLANSALSPECIAMTWAGAAAGVSLAASYARKSGVNSAQFATASKLTVLVLAAQMINVPVLDGASTHLIGGALLAWYLGPSLAALCMTSVLVVQTMILGDGGLAALGANVINMALIPCLVVCLISSRSKSYSAVVLSTWLGIFAAAGGLVLQTISMTSSGTGDFAFRILTNHVWAGLFEATVTLAALAALRVAADVQAKGRLDQTMLAALFALILVVPFSSAIPDGYESAAATTGQAHLLHPYLESTEGMFSAGHFLQEIQHICVSAVSYISADNSLVLAVLAIYLCSVCNNFVVPRLLGRSRLAASIKTSV
jgi:cobalt/nickel transport system permease protein